jgi:RES domain
LIDKFTRDSRRETLFKLANFPRAGVDELLLRRGINADAIDDVKAAIGMVGSPISLADALNYSFERHGAPPAYGVGRFGNGKWPVFYSALEKETCEEEVRHHLGSAIKVVPYTRYFQFMACDFDDEVLDLRGKEKEHPDLVSPTDSGYPFCQVLAQSAAASSVDGLLTPSARNRPDGVCSPIFTRSALTNPRFIDSPRVAV